MMAFSLSLVVLKASAMSVKMQENARLITLIGRPIDQTLSKDDLQKTSREGFVAT